MKKMVGGALLSSANGQKMLLFYQVILKITATVTSHKVEVTPPYLDPPPGQQGRSRRFYLNFMRSCQRQGNSAKVQMLR